MMTMTRTTESSASTPTSSSSPTLLLASEPWAILRYWHAGGHLGGASPRGGTERAPTTDPEALGSRHSDDPAVAVQSLADDVVGCAAEPLPESVTDNGRNA